MRKAALSAFIIFCCALFFGGRTAQEGSLPDRTIGGVQPPGDAPDGASAWTAIGPYGGEIRGLARNPKYPNEIYASASSYPSQFFRSTNNGLTWTRTWICDSGISDIVTDPKNADIIYAYAGYKINNSTDRGTTFPESIAVPNNFHGYSGRMAIHPANSKIIYITGSFITNSAAGNSCPAVAKSVNGGQTWTIVKFDPTAQWGSIHDIGIHPKNPKIVYLCGTSTAANLTKARVYRSTNGGGSFKNITKDAVFNPGTFSQAYALALHPTDPNTALVGHSNGVARTTNGGRSWENQNAQGRLAASALAADKTNPNTFYGLGLSNAEGYRGCWKSVDCGKTWTNYSIGIYGWGARLLVNGSTIIAGTRAGIFKSLNAGVLWKASHTGIRASQPDSFGVAPSSPRTIYTEVGNYALFKTVNGGGAWTKCPDFYRCESILGFVVQPSDSKKVFFLAGG